jgi:hypothetical protein
MPTEAHGLDAIVTRHRRDIEASVVGILAGLRPVASGGASGEMSDIRISSQNDAPAAV